MIQHIKRYPNLEYGRCLIIESHQNHILYVLQKRDFHIQYTCNMQFMFCRDMEKEMNRTCISCGVVSQRYGKSWDLWGQCVNCAKRSNPDYYNVQKCPECGNTSNNTAALCWRLYGKCGKCTYKKEDHRKHVLCTHCNEVAYKLAYQKLGRRPIDLFYCMRCTGIISRNGFRIFLLKEKLEEATS